MVTEYLRVLKDKLGDSRYTHSLCVADSARELAARYGAESENAYTAGLLHDILKDASGEEQLCALKKSGIILTPSETANPKLWHAPAGAAYLEHELGITDEDMLNAVRYHTTGRAGMSLLEKVIYIADYVSADRTYNGADTMRTLAAQSLEAAMLFALEFGIGHLAKTKQVIHTNSVECYNELIIRQREKEREGGVL